MQQLSPHVLLVASDELRLPNIIDNNVKNFFTAVFLGQEVRSERCCSNFGELIATASNTSPPTMKLVAPASEATVNVRIPAGDRDGPSPLRRSRSEPINRPIPSATARFRMMNIPFLL